jgi:hypothetical protein
MATTTQPAILNLCAQLPTKAPVPSCQSLLTQARNDCFNVTNRWQELLKAIDTFNQSLADSAALKAKLAEAKADATKEQGVIDHAQQSISAGIALLKEGGLNPDQVASLNESIKQTQALLAEYQSLLSITNNMIQQFQAKLAAFAGAADALSAAGLAFSKAQTAAQASIAAYVACVANAVTTAAVVTTVVAGTLTTSSSGSSTSTSTTDNNRGISSGSGFGGFGTGGSSDIHPVNSLGDTGL